MIPKSPPHVSIIIATYNWSSALRCAIESVLLQTFTNFELLVVGDGCTDASEQTVRAIADERVQWMNLPSNSGAQSRPNNHGIENSRGEYIAYLGHDDLWFPTHLESLVATMDRTSADIAAGVCALHGPPGSGVMSVTGAFAGSEYTQREVIVPSSMLHRRSLVAKIGAWKDPATESLPVDIEFVKRAHGAGAKIVSSGELTVFKFNAAWRRNSYLTRSAAEQEQMLARIRRGEDVPASTLIEVVRAFHADTYVLVEAPKPERPGEIFRRNAKFKGTSKEQIDLRPVTKRTRFLLDDQLGGFEWHGVERHKLWGSLRWSGPSRRSTLEFPILRDRPLELRIHVVWHCQRDLSEIKVAVDGEPVPVRAKPSKLGATILAGVIPERTGSVQPLRVAIQVARTQRPIDLGASDDRRWLGVAVSWVEFEPAKG